MVNRKEGLSIRSQCNLVSMSRSSFYYKSPGETKENLWIMRLMDEHYLKHSTEGVLRMRDFLLALGIVALTETDRIIKEIDKIGLLS